MGATIFNAEPGLDRHGNAISDPNIADTPAYRQYTGSPKLESRGLREEKKGRPEAEEASEKE
jgi:hypothetical protein